MVINICEGREKERKRGREGRRKRKGSRAPHVFNRALPTGNTHM